MQFRGADRKATTLLIVTALIAIVSLGIAVFCRGLIPKYRAVHQGAIWRETLQGAEAGVNHTIDILNQFASSSRSAGSYAWVSNGWTFTDSAYTINGERTLSPTLFPVLGGLSNVKLTKIAVDVYTRNPDVASYYPWFRIRSTARADLPDRFVGGDRRDNALRRMKLSAKQGGKDAPYLSRTVEVIVKPQFRFKRAITTLADLTLANSSKWVVDSFDSGDPNKSDAGTAAGGVYPSKPAERQANGGIASLKTLPAGTPYGPLITGNGATVAGDVQTVGGDNPATPGHENVSGNSGMDQSRIYDNFDEDIPPVSKPVWNSVSAPPSGNTGFATGSDGAPKQYIIYGNLGAFTVKAPSPGTTGYVEILVNGNVDIGNGGGAKIVIPPNVYATIYVDGNIDFGNGDVNTDDASSQVATHLTVFGVSNSSNATYTASGNATQALSFYGPNYNVAFSGTVTTVGAIVAKTFLINGGGNGGVHYDEALGKGGDISGWEVASYFEDARGD